MRRQRRRELDRQLPVLAAATHALDAPERAFRHSIRESVGESLRTLDDLVFGHDLPSRIADHTRATLFRPRRPSLSTAQNDNRDFDVFSSAGANPTVIPVLESRSAIGTPGSVEDMVHDFLIAPASGKFCLACPAGAMPVTASTVRL